MKRVNYFFTILIVFLKAIGYSQGDAEIKYLTEKRLLRENTFGVVSSRDAKLKYLFDKKERLQTPETIKDYQEELNHINRVDKAFAAFDHVYNLTGQSMNESIDFECLRNAVNIYKKTCGWGEYELNYVREFSDACKKKMSIDDMTEAFKEMC